ncbi:DUF2000 domain-containing protein [Agrobacterium vitis]|uniref:DUF2000 family protein n=1 Tax=Agrobacterium vitis TaxID=373 RepID=A0AAE5AW15_AGRVI|nr:MULTISPECIES: DUF2000 domain-containing protein [Alphaproteobacteria]EIZ79445.1 hypothetical protein WSK_1976 [Novosphingobium sp. Rr 2-17]MCF1499349.1 DUF2000 domain-containing protein [Allorhizobium sp. Av2]MCM2439399.1 DUF2000 domain-containing protein [Agrobacterium vitis]MUZ57697.1 DUF2000 family protein [Agrobacterium vitis]
MSLKPVVILAETLPIGLKVNFAAVLAMSLGKLMPELIGADTPTEDGVGLPGITTVGVPILTAPQGALSGLFLEAGSLPLRLVYMRAAFEARTYEDYTLRIAAAPFEAHDPQALLLAGPRKAVDRICGRLALVK